MTSQNKYAIGWRGGMLYVVIIPHYVGMFKDVFSYHHVVIYKTFVSRKGAKVAKWQSFAPLLPLRLCVKQNTDIMDRKTVTERNKLLHSVEKLLEGPMIFLGFVWLVLLVIELIWGLTKLLEYLSLSIWALFIVDFVIKFILAPLKTVFLKKNWLTALSLIIPAFRLFRLLRFLR